MAVNQVSLFFLPPRWQKRILKKAVPFGNPIETSSQGLFEIVRIDDSVAPPVQAADVKAWLLERGFVSANWGDGRILEYGQVRSIFGQEKAIEVTVSEEAGENTDVYCRFTLPKKDAPRLENWAAFAVALCTRFGLRIEDGIVAPCGEAEFLAAVRGNPNWQDFARQFGWNGG
jgi:hypothetical protein